MQRTIIGIRSDLDLTQEEMAKKLNLPYATYQRYERYETKIPVEVMIRIADMVNIVDIRDIRFK